MDPTSLVPALTRATGELAKSETVAGLTKRLFGPKADAIAERWALGDKEKLYENVARAVHRAREILAELGLSARDVPLKLIHPMLDGVANEDDPDLCERWAHMLANVWDARDKRKIVLPVFASMLKDLSPREVKFLDALSAHALIRRGLSIRDLQQVYAGASLAVLPKPEYVAHFAEQEILREEDKTYFGVMLDILYRGRIIVIPMRSESATFTDLGWAFVRACQAPLK